MIVNEMALDSTVRLYAEPKSLAGQTIGTYLGAGSNAALVRRPIVINSIRIGRLVDKVAGHTADR
jgi:hypothetical protein